MRFFISILGVEVLSFGLQINGDGRTRYALIDGTGGSFELDTSDLSGEEDGEEWDISPDDPVAFGFRR